MQLRCVEHNEGNTRAAGTGFRKRPRIASKLQQLQHFLDTGFHEGSHKTGLAAPHWPAQILAAITRLLELRHGR